MIQRIPVLNAISNLLHRTNPRQQVGLSIARLMTQLDLESMPFEEGVQPSRRDAHTRQMAIGIWLIPLNETGNPDDADMNTAIPAVTCDLRRLGIGVLTPAKLPSKRFILAVADLENVWRFFVADSRHQSDRPGGWYQLGLYVEKVWQPGSLQTVAFRKRVENLFEA